MDTTTLLLTATGAAFAGLWWFVRRNMEFNDKVLAANREDVNSLKSGHAIIEARLRDGQGTFSDTRTRLDNLDQTKVGRMEFESRMCRNEDDHVKMQESQEQIKASIDRLKAEFQSLNGDLRSTIDRAEGAVKSLQSIAANMVTIRNPGQSV